MSWLDSDGTSSEGRILAGSAETDVTATALFLPAAWEEALCPAIKMAWVQVDSHTTHCITQEVPQKQWMKHGIENSKPARERLKNPESNKT